MAQALRNLLGLFRQNYDSILSYTWWMLQGSREFCIVLAEDDAPLLNLMN